jgi:hypothetical protein
LFFEAKNRVLNNYSASCFLCPCTLSALNLNTVIPQDDGLMDCWIIGFEFKKNHRCWILRKNSE